MSVSLEQRLRILQACHHSALAPAPSCTREKGKSLATDYWTDVLVLRTAHYLARWARGAVAFQAPRQRVELVRDVCRRVLDVCFVNSPPVSEALMSLSFKSLNW